MVRGGMAKGGIGIGPPPGQDRRAVDNQVAAARQPQPQAGADQQDEEHLARRGARGAPAPGLLRLAGHARLPIGPQRQPAGQR
jgi:hypothetical protein